MPANPPPRAPQHPDSRGYYLALHVSPDASQQEISRAFRALIRVRHPDVGHPGQGGDDARSILAAFAVLRNPRTRAEYDRAEHQAAAGTHPSRQNHRDAPGHDVPVRHVSVRDVPVRTAPVHAVPVREVPVGEVPLRIVRHRGPLLGVSPVRWERGPG